MSLTWKAIVWAVAQALIEISKHLPTIAFLLASREYEKFNDQISEGERSGNVSDGEFARLLRKRKEAKSLRDVLQPKAIPAEEGGDVPD